MADEEFGITEWGADWVRVAQAKLSANSRLPKARSLARNDKVEIGALGTNAIQSRVDGAKVTIILPAYSAAQLKRVERILAADAEAGSHSPGDLSEAVHIALTGAGLDPVPNSVDAACSCTAKAQPCIHKLATFYELSRRLDEQPTLALTLRGRSSGSEAAKRTERWIPLAALSATDFYKPGPRGS